MIPESISSSPVNLISPGNKESFPPTEDDDNKPFHQAKKREFFLLYTFLNELLKDVLEENYKMLPEAY